MTIVINGGVACSCGCSTGCDLATNPSEAQAKLESPRDSIVYNQAPTS